MAAASSYQLQNNTMIQTRCYPSSFFVYLSMGFPQSFRAFFLLHSTHFTSLELHRKVPHTSMLFFGLVAGASPVTSEASFAQFIMFVKSRLHCIVFVLGVNDTCKVLSN